MNHHIPPKTLVTERLILRPFKSDDADQMFKSWCQDERVTKFLTWDTHQSVDQTQSVLDIWVQSYKENPYYHYAVVVKKTNELIGSIGLVKMSEHNERGEIGYCIAYDYWNQGIVSEAVSELIAYLFSEIGFHKLVAKHASHNQASGRVMQKCGMTQEGILSEDHKNKHGLFDDMVVYGLLKSTYLKTKEANTK